MEFKGCLKANFGSVTIHEHLRVEKYTVFLKMLKEI